MGNEWYGEYDEVCADGWIPCNDDYYDPPVMTEEELDRAYDNYIAMLEGRKT